MEIYLIYCDLNSSEEEHYGTHYIYATINLPKFSKILPELLYAFLEKL